MVYLTASKLHFINCFCKRYEVIPVFNDYAMMAFGRRGRHYSRGKSPCTSKTEERNRLQNRSQRDAQDQIPMSLSGIERRGPGNRCVKSLSLSDINNITIR
jgi:hypothetical protein